MDRYGLCLGLSDLERRGINNEQHGENETGTALYLRDFAIGNYSFNDIWILVKQIRSVAKTFRDVKNEHRGTFVVWFKKNSIKMALQRSH